MEVVWLGHGPSVGEDVAQEHSIDFQCANASRKPEVDPEVVDGPTPGCAAASVLGDPDGGGAFGWEAHRRSFSELI